MYRKKIKFFNIDFITKKIKIKWNQKNLAKFNKGGKKCPSFCIKFISFFEFV
jgi:hypothetical protein